MDEPVPEALRGLLQVGRQAYVAVEESGRVHVTPVLYAWSAGRLWFSAAAGTKKVQILRTAAAAGVLVEAGSRRVLVVGQVHISDPARPWTLLGSPRELLDRAAAVGLYGLRNAADLAGFARDAALLRNGPVRPRRRVLIGLRPAASAVFDGDRLGGRWGAWPDRSAPADPAGPGAGTPAVLGWSSPAGPVAVPVRWNAGRSAAAVDPAAVTMLALHRQSPATLVTDDYGGPGPSPKLGSAISGSGRLVVGDDGSWAVIEPDKLTGWQGTTTGSRRRSA